MKKDLDATTQLDELAFTAITKEAKIVDEIECKSVEASIKKDSAKKE